MIYISYNIPTTELDINDSIVVQLINNLVDITQVSNKDKFKFAFGQQSGVIDINKDQYELPRFPINEKYGDLERFSFLIKLGPLEFNEISINDMSI